MAGDDADRADGARPRRGGERSLASFSVMRPLIVADSSEGPFSGFRDINGIRVPFALWIDFGDFEQLWYN